jgi:ATP-dependent exoDNAse (exonuclease V) beta subunit
MIQVFDRNNENFVTFNPRYFSFKLNNSKKLSSVTKIVKSFFPEFDKDGVSAAYAKKHGLTQEEVLAMWDAKAKRSTEIGNAVHKYIENTFKDIAFDKKEYDEEIQKRFDVADTAISQLGEYYDLIGCELIVFDPEIEGAGILDLLMKGKKTNKFYLIDWKTNESIKMENSFQGGLDVLAHVDDCNFNHYSLQLGLLKKMIPNVYDVDPKNIIAQLIHLSPERAFYYPVRDFSNEIELMISNKKAA